MMLISIIAIFPRIGFEERIDRFFGFLRYVYANCFAKLMLRKSNSSLLIDGN